MNQSSASAASLECETGALNFGNEGFWRLRAPKTSISLDFEFQAVIKSASSAASRKPKSREGSSRGVQNGGSAGGRRPRGTLLELSSLDLGFLEATLAADLVTP